MALPYNETVVDITGLTDELGAPYQGYQTNVDWPGGSNWVDIVRHTDPKTLNGRFPNGDTPLGEAGERYIRVHRVTQVSTQINRNDRPNFEVILDSSGHITSIEGNAAGFYPPGYSGMATLFDRTGINPDKQIQFACDGQGLVIKSSWFGIPGYSYSVTPLVMAEPRVLAPGTKEVSGDMSPTRCLSRQLPDGYYLKTGSILGYDTVEGPSQRNGVAVGLTMYGSHYIRILDNNFDNPKAEHVWGCCTVPGDQWNGDREAATLSEDGLLIHGYRGGWPTICGKSTHDESYIQAEGGHGAVGLGVHTVFGRLTAFIKVGTLADYPGGDVVRSEQKDGELGDFQGRRMYFGEGDQFLDCAGGRLRWYDGVEYNYVDIRRVG